MLKSIPRHCLLFITVLILAAVKLHAQTQEDFNNKLAEVYNNSSDKRKALALAKEMYTMVEKTKPLQTYSNYYLLKNVFENQAGDTILAKKCGEKAEKIMNATVGINPEMTVDSTNPTMAWATYFFPGLFKNGDPQNAEKALGYLNRNPELKTFTNYTYIGYAFERNNDFLKAKENYEQALALAKNEKEEYHSYLFYTNFLTRTGDYLKADEYIRKMETLSEQASGYFQVAYKSEAMSARVVYYLNTGDYQSYVQASEKNYDYFSETWHKSDKTGCDPYPGIRFTNAAFGKEMLKEYAAAEKLWKSRDSVNYIWVNCYNKTYPNAHYFPVSMYPVYLVKRGKFSSLAKPASFFIKETEDHYNSYSQYADISAHFAKATQLGFLGSSNYAELFKPVMEQVKTTRNFRESTEPFSNYAYFSMRDRKLEESRKTYDELFELNSGWINDIIFTFGEKAFVTYYNTKLKSGYDNFHSFVKIAREKHPALYPQLAEQAYTNLLFTKSISLQGAKKRKEAFLGSNDETVHRLYNEWIDTKQQLIRQYMKATDPAGADTANAAVSQAQLKKMQDQVGRMENELVLKSKDFKKYLTITPPGWKAVRDQLKEGEAAIEMIRFQWRDKVYYSDTAYYAAYIITSNSQYPEVIYLADAAKDLDDKYYKQYKNNIHLKLDDKHSYDRYWKAIAAQLAGIKKVHFSPDGIYHLINIATLKNPASGQFLLDEIEIHATTSGTDINKNLLNNDAIKTATLIGRPSYKTDVAVAVAPSANESRSFVRTFRDNNVPDLPGTEIEVLAIKKEMDQHKIQTTSYLREKATEDRMYQLHSPGILHIATHGYWSPAGENATEGYRVFNAMVNSGLLLAGVVNYYSSKEFPDTYDGILTAYEAQNLDLGKTSLVILSACETNLGYLDAGEGVYGLQRAFRAAGAGSIMTSLWKVDDNATKDFMIFFYQQYLRSNDKLAAFRLAQKAIKEKYKHPYFWGAFVMMGE